MLIYNILVSWIFKFYHIQTLVLSYPYPHIAIYISENTASLYLIMKKVEIIFQDLSHILSTNNKLPLLKQLKTIDSQLSLLAMVESKKQMYIHTTRSLYLDWHRMSIIRKTTVALPFDRLWQLYYCKWLCLKVGQDWGLYV